MNGKKIPQPKIKGNWLKGENILNKYKKWLLPIIYKDIFQIIRKIWNNNGKAGKGQTLTIN